MTDSERTGEPDVKTITGILILSVLALAGYRKSFTRISPFKRRSLFLTGTEFILVGFLLGNSFLGLLDGSTLHLLYPFLILGLGWIGLLSGIQLEWKGLKLFSSTSYVWVICSGLCGFTIVYAGLYFLLHPWFSGDPLFHPAVSVLAVAGLCSGQTSLALWFLNAPESARARGQFLKFFSSMHDVMAILLFGILIAGFHTPAGWETPSGFPGERFLISILLGVLMGVLFTILFRTRLDETEKVIVLTGLILFGGGISYLLGISPLFVYLVAGILLGNMSLKRDQTFHLLLRIERPLYLIFLLVAGAYMVIESPMILVFAFCYCVVRAVALGAGGGLFLDRLVRQAGLPHRFRLGWGLLSQGAVAVALAIHFRLWLVNPSPSPLFDITFSVLVIAVFINEWVSPFGLAFAMKEE